MADLIAEAYRLRLLCGLEERLVQAGYSSVAGVDEAGRGALAGPVVAAAVVLDPRRLVPGVDDSKRIEAGDRERLASAIRRVALASAVVAVPPDVIDRINILEATRRAMREALARLRPAPSCAVIDAVPVRGLGFPCLPVIRGDAISYSVACASILAKVGRDRMMVALDGTHPGYGFARHKGYSAPEHLAALATLGPCPAHRLTFRSVLPRAEEPAAPARRARSTRRAAAARRSRKVRAS
jgi:ribonuclease HII